MSTLPHHKHHLTERDQKHYIDQIDVLAVHPGGPERADATRYSAWNVALILVGERDAKHDLVDLVGYLLDRTIRLEETIRRQAAAARSGMDAAKRSAHIVYDLADKARRESAPDVLASERAANAILTQENERMHMLLEQLLETVGDQRMRERIKDVLGTRP
ncbi:hypothetical protein [Paraburkholderia phenoliruptrix]|uniref:hypothetical protein n=1 Tax=Paraburkholderia phenoliruptrix TaxID=252970 RepID=UPI0034D0213E